MPNSTDERFVYSGRIDSWTDAEVGTETATWGDARDGHVYLVSERLKLSVEVALATRRPLLLRGEPGTGKSSLAAFVARNFEARYYEHTVTNTTEATDLLWKFDAVRKLAAATGADVNAGDLNDFDFIEPGVLWWVIDPTSAARRGAPDGSAPKTLADPPGGDSNLVRRPDRAVVLIDEIDKADPAVPNALLVPIGSSEFTIAETGFSVTQPAEEKERVQDLLVVITTNETRELPAAFLRRCVVHHLEFHDEDALVTIAEAHAPWWGHSVDGKRHTLFRAVAKRLETARAAADDEGERRPSTAEYLDAVRACLELGVTEITEENATWKRIERVAVTKVEPGE